MDHQTETINGLVAMGFNEAVVQQAYQKADIKTVEGLINYIEANPQINNAGAMDEENPNPSQPGAPVEEETPQESDENLVAITSHINTQFRDQIIQMGYERHPAEKALFMTQNKSLQAGLDWLNQHKDDADFNEQLFIVGKPPAGGVPGMPVQSNLTPEEAKQKARELQKVLAAKLKAKEKALAEQQEKDRVRQGKELSMAKRQLEETTVRLNIERIKREKKEKEDAMAKVLAQIEHDKYARTGKRPKKKLLPVPEILAGILKKMQRIYPAGSMSGGQVKTCFKTCGIYISKFYFLTFL